MIVSLIELIKVVIIGIVEGITEWLPVSSTGHMLILDEFIQMDVTPEFKEMFIVVIQLGAIMAVVLSFWSKMWPFTLKDKENGIIKKDTFSIWFKVVVACIPGAIVTLLFDDFVEAHFETLLVIAIALVVYGIAFILVENTSDKRVVKVETINDITYKTALMIGMFQVLSIVPGTSRSGATIIGALLIGVSRVAAAEFTFFLAVPVMFGLSLVKVLKFGFAYTSAEVVILLVGVVVAFVVSLLVIKFLMQYIKKHDFKVFGWYRIVAGLAIIGYVISQNL